MTRSSIFTLAIWFGVCSGMVEGALYLMFQQMRWLAWNEALVSVGPDQIWISALFNLAGFLLAGLLLAIASPVIRWKRWPAAIVFVFAWLAFFDFIALSGRLRASGAAVLAAGAAFQCARWFARHDERVMAGLRRGLPAMTAAAVVICAGIPAWSFAAEKIAVSRLPAAPGGAPNVVLIVLDTVRAKQLSAYGYARPTSPNMDALAARGALFENAYATSPWTLPSHVSMLSGQYPFQHGQSPRRNFAALGSQQLRLATVLRERGYATAGFVSNTIWGAPWAGLDQGFTHYESLYGNFADMALRTFYGRKLKKYLRKWIPFDPMMRTLASERVKSFLEWLPQDRERPFFAFFNFLEAHEPALAQRGCEGKFNGAPESAAQAGLAHLSEQQQRERARMTGEYDNAICSLDESIATLLQELEKRQRLQNTLVVITSDHGEMLGEQGIFDHGNALYEQVLRVPLIASWPGKIPVGVRVPTPVSAVDLPATILELAEIAGHALPGQSLTALWQASPTPAQVSPVLAEVSAAAFPDTPEKWPVKRGWLRALREGKWKLIVHEGGQHELYNLEEDPREQHNLSNTKEFRSVNDSLYEKIAAMVPEVRRDASAAQGGQ